jgi:hypothetical protein
VADPLVAELGGYVGPTGSPITALSASEGGGALSGLADIFQSVSTGIASVYRTVNPPQQGTLVFNPATGQYAPAGVNPSLVAQQNLANQLNLLPIVVIVLVGALAYKLVR